ncbi:MAG: PHB depolymerase family esterase [Deltaproteobacteria bacterium]|nr:PHB depolymerase family esterase [Deltaproteobacteria bacterium]
MSAVTRLMPALALVFAGALLLPRTALAQFGTLVENVTLQHAGVTRYFNYYLPFGLPASHVPLLLVLHGGGRSKDDVTVGALSRFAGLADTHKFIIVAPNGTVPGTGLSGPMGEFNWNDCRNDAGVSETGADDVGFIGALVDWMEVNFNIDALRVYATGPSNGGMMSYRLAFELSDRIAAVAGIVANQPVNSECVPLPVNRPSLLIMNSTADVYMPWGGGQVIGNRGSVLSAEQTRDYWRSLLGTTPMPQHTVFPDLDPNDGGVVEFDLYTGGIGGKRVAFYRVNGAGHLTSSISHQATPEIEQIFGKQNHDIETAIEIWSFFENETLTQNPIEVPAIPQPWRLLPVLIVVGFLLFIRGQA